MTDAKPQIAKQIATAVKRERQRLGLSLSEAAKRADIAKSTLSQLESGTGNPSIETMWALASAYSIPLSQILEQPQPQVNVIRAAEAPSFASHTADYTATLLSPSPPRARRDVYLITANPGEVKQSQPHPAGTVEHVIIGRGGAKLTVSETEVELGPGDYLRYSGDCPHSFEALEPDTLAITIVEME